MPVSAEGLLNQRIKEYAQILSTDRSCYNQDQTYLNQQDASTVKTNKIEQGDSYNQPVERSKISQIPLPEEPYRLGVKLKL